MRTVRVLFLRATPEDHWINRLVSYVDPPFCHVEVEFDISEGVPEPPAATFFGSPLQNAPGPKADTMATSIYSGETVFLRPRTFANPNYTVLSLSVSDTAFARMFRFASQAVEKRHHFSSLAMCMSYLPCPCACSSGTFCSDYVTRLLQEGNVQAVQRLPPERARPSTLYKILSKTQNQCFSSVPYKLSLIGYSG